MPGDQVKVLLALAGWDQPCYKVTVAHDGTSLAGYVLGDTLPAIREFRIQREKASVAAAEADARLIAEEAAEKAAAARKAADGTTAGPANPLISTQFEDFSARDSRGKTISLSGLKGRVTLVTFWSPKSTASQDQLMRAMPLYSQLHKSGLEAVGISMDPHSNQIDAALDDRSPNWPQVPDQAGLAAKYHVDPKSGETFVLDASHRVVAAGPMGPEIEKAVRQLLTTP